MIPSPRLQRLRLRQRRAGRASVANPWRLSILSRWFLFSFLATNCRCCCFQMMQELRPRPSARSDAVSPRRWRFRSRWCHPLDPRRWKEGASLPPPTSEDEPSPSMDAAGRSLCRIRPRRRSARSFLSEAAAVLAFPSAMPLPLLRSPKPRATTRSVITVFAVFICFHAAYTALLHRILRGRFLSMVLLSEVAAVPDYGDDRCITTASDEGDVGGTKKKASERLPQIIRELRFYGSDGGLDNEVSTAETGTKTGIESSAAGAGTMEVLWEGYLLYACAGRTRLTDGWYGTGNNRGGSDTADGKGDGGTTPTSSALLVRVSGDGRTATVYILRPAGAHRPLSTSDLLLRRKPLCIVEDLEERLGWRRVLGDARRSVLVAGRGCPPSSTQALSGSYSFVYRDYVGVEEKFVMVGRRGGLSPLRLTEDTTLTLHDDGTCSLVDSGSILGILPVKTRNLGRWYGSNSPLGTGGGCYGGGSGSIGATIPPNWIEWETSSLRIGSRMLGRTMEMKNVTDALRAGPWPVLSLPVTGDDPDGKGKVLLLMVNRPSYGWLIFSRVHR